ncbi:hypothetical protein ACFQ60_25755 [Streptomyces zhihengii]
MLVLDSSASMAEDDGTGRSRMESARQAVGTVVDALPDGHPTGLRVHGAGRSRAARTPARCCPCGRSTGRA